MKQVDFGVIVINIMKIHTNYQTELISVSIVNTKFSTEIKKNWLKFGSLIAFMEENISWFDKN